MQTVEYHLYRAKFIKSVQIGIFHDDLSSRQVFEMALAERPSLELRKNNVWHIGNIEQITSDSGRFAVGRTTTTTLEKFDSNTGNFKDLVDDSGPYTFVYFDSRLGLLGIGKRAKVAADVTSIAKKIERLLSKSEIVKAQSISVRVDFIPDPESFLEKLRSAYSIKRFNAHFTGPNPIDADELFQKPMSYYCQQLGGDRGSVAVSGKSLNDDVVANVAKSTAATANAASALIQIERGTRPVLISFKGDAQKVIIDQDASKMETLEAILYAYNEIRG